MVIREHETFYVIDPTELHFQLKKDVAGQLIVYPVYDRDTFKRHILSFVSLTALQMESDRLKRIIDPDAPYNAEGLTVQDILDRLYLDIDDPDVMTLRIAEEVERVVSLAVKAANPDIPDRFIPWVTEEYGDYSDRVLADLTVDDLVTTLRKCMYINCII